MLSIHILNTHTTHMCRCSRDVKPIVAFQLNGSYYYHYSLDLQDTLLLILIHYQIYLPLVSSPDIPEYDSHLENHSQNICLYENITQIQKETIVCADTTISNMYANLFCIYEIHNHKNCLFNQENKKFISFLLFTHIHGQRARADPSQFSNVISSLMYLLRHVVETFISCFRRSPISYTLYQIHSLEHCKKCKAISLQIDDTSAS